MESFGLIITHDIWTIEKPAAKLERVNSNTQQLLWQYSKSGIMETQQNTLSKSKTVM